jgi:hypothetical protein
MTRLSDDEHFSGEAAALECSGESDPDLIPIATFDPNSDSNAHCSAMACTDSLECFGYWDLVNLVVSNRGIYTS